MPTLLGSNANYHSLVESIQKLQEKFSLNDSLKIISDLQGSLDYEIGEAKLAQVLGNNTDLTGMQKVLSKLQDAVPIDAEYRTSTWNSNDCTSAKHAPLTNCDVERSFSMYSQVLSDNRQNLTENSITQILFCYCNKSL